MAVTETLRAYFSQLTHDPSVRSDLDRSLLNARAAYSRARSAVQTIRRGPEIERRRRLRRPVLLIAAALAAAVAAALYPDLQARLSRSSSTEQA